MSGDRATALQPGQQSKIPYKKIKLVYELSFNLYETGEFHDPLAKCAAGMWLICLATVHSNSLQEGEHTDRQVQEPKQVLLSSDPMVASSGGGL